MVEEVAEVCACCTACDFSASDAGGGEGAADAIDCVVVEHVELRRGAVPVGDVGFVPDFPVPGLNFCFAVASDAVGCPAEYEFFPAGVVGGDV